MLFCVLVLHLLLRFYMLPCAPVDCDEARAENEGAALFECHLFTITKVFPSTFSHTLIIVTEHNATHTNQSTTQVLLSNPQPLTTIYNTSRTSNISQTLEEALSRRTRFAKSSHDQSNHSCSIQHMLVMLSSLALAKQTSLIQNRVQHKKEQ